MSINYLEDKEFLKSLDSDNNKFFWVRIEILGDQRIPNKTKNGIEYIIRKEVPLRNIEGKVQPGSSVSLNGNSSVRRTCNITILAENAENDLTNIENLLSVNKKIKIFEGIENNIDKKYNDIIWFPLGVFVINQPSITHNANGCLISLNCKDKMCLLNGENGGILPASVIFHEYSQTIARQYINKDPTKVYLDNEGKEYVIVKEPNNYTIYVYQNGSTKNYYSWSKEYGWKKEENDKAVGTIIDFPQKIYNIIQSLVHFYGGEDLSKIFISDVPLEIKQLIRYTGSGTLYFKPSTSVYTINENDLITDNNTTWREFKYNEDVGYVYTDFTYPGTLVSSFGDSICSILDKIKNALGNYEYFYDLEGNFVFQEIRNYLNTSYDITDESKLNNYGYINLYKNNLAVIGDNNYKADFRSNSKSVYTFNEGNGLVSSFSNSPNYSNLKNDYHIWGENNNDKPTHYHLSIQKKPEISEHKVVFLKEDGEYTGQLRLPQEGDVNKDIINYTPADWRAELYLQGLEEQQQGKRPDIYKQEILDLFGDIYDFYKKEFKSTLVTHPNDLTYFIDYLEPNEDFYDCSIEAIGQKTFTYQQKNIKRIYNTVVPDYILIDVSMDNATKSEIISRCINSGQKYANVNHVVYSKLSLCTVGYSSQETMRELLYQYTNYNETINISSVPIYYLDVNTRITVQDKKSGIFGDYIINNITLPLDAGGTMTISASRALERI